MHQQAKSDPGLDLDLYPILDPELKNKQEINLLYKRIINI